MNKIYSNICTWKDSYFRSLDGHGTTFSGHEGWDEHHPLYRCVWCDGFNEKCKGYHKIGKDEEEMFIVG